MSDKNHLNPPQILAPMVDAKSQSGSHRSFRVSETTPEHWRCDGIGPKFLKLSGRVLYWLVDIEAFEEASLSTSTRSAVAANVAA
jgi:hypothetical protein